MNKKKYSRSGGTKEVTQAVKTRLAYAFRVYDHRDSGVISFSELKSLMGALSLPNEDGHVRELLKDAGLPADANSIGKDEFVAVVGPRVPEPGSVEELTAVFGKFANRSYKMEMAELRDLADMAGYPITETDLAYILGQGDKDKDGGWKLEEFINIVHKRSD